MEQKEKIPFETLIKGEYREDFQKKVEEILRKRFKNQRDGKPSKSDGIPAGDGKPLKSDEIPAGGGKPPKSDGIPAGDGKPLKSDGIPAGGGKPPKSDGTPADDGKPPKSDGIPAEREDGFLRLLESARAARDRYPGLDLRRELASPRFADMVLRGVDVQAAYEAAHHEEMLRGAMAYAVRQAAEKLARARASRPAEHGSEGQSAAVEKADPRHMTAEERAEIRRRVLERGEKVWF